MTGSGGASGWGFGRRELRGLGFTAFAFGQGVDGSKQRHVQRPIRGFFTAFRMTVWEGVEDGGVEG
jgi:hypothetical protein